MDDLAEIPTGKVSKINSASFSLMRLHNLWLDCNKFSRSGEYEQWNRCIDALWRELAGDLTDDDPDVTKMKEFNLKLNDLTIDNVNKPHPFKKVSPGYLALRSKQYSLLDSKEIFVRRLQNKQGKGSAYKDEFDDGIE